MRMGFGGPPKHRPWAFTLSSQKSEAISSTDPRKAVGLEHGLRDRGSPYRPFRLLLRLALGNAHAAFKVERGTSAKDVAAQPSLGYTACAEMAEMEIPGSTY